MRTGTAETSEGAFASAYSSDQNATTDVRTEGISMSSATQSPSRESRKPRRVRGSVYPHDAAGDALPAGFQAFVSDAVFVIRHADHRHWLGALWTDERTGEYRWIWTEGQGLAMLFATAEDADWAAGKVRPVDVTFGPDERFQALMVRRPARDRGTLVRVVDGLLQSLPVGPVSAPAPAPVGTPAEPAGLLAGTP